MKAMFHDLATIKRKEKETKNTKQILITKSILKFCQKETLKKAKWRYVFIF